MTLFVKGAIPLSFSHHFVRFSNSRWGKRSVHTGCPHVFRLDSLDDIQVMTPMHKGMAGVVNLNAGLQMLLNPTGKEIIRGGRCFRINDKVMQVTNNYDKVAMAIARVLATSTTSVLSWRRLTKSYFVMLDNPPPMKVDLCAFLEIISRAL